MKLFVPGAVVVMAVIVGLLVVFGSFYTVDQGEEGVLLTNGAVRDTVGPGLHFKIPFFDTVALVSLQQQSEVYDKVNSFTGDQQPADLKVSVLFHVPPGEGKDVYARYGTIEQMVDRLVSRKLPAILKDVFGQYDAASVVKQRAKFNADVLSSLQAGVVGPIAIDGVQVEDIAFSEAYQQGIEAKQLAEVAVAKQQQVLAQQKVEAEITVTNAQAAADAVVATATAQAQATRLAGDAEAYAIKAKGDALTNNPQIVQLTLANRWNGALPTSMVPGSAVPFLPVH